MQLNVLLKLIIFWICQLFRVRYPNTFSVGTFRLWYLGSLGPSTPKVNRTIWWSLQEDAGRLEVVDQKDGDDNETNYFYFKVKITYLLSKRSLKKICFYITTWTVTAVDKIVSLNKSTVNICRERDIFRYHYHRSRMSHA